MSSEIRGRNSTSSFPNAQNEKVSGQKRGLEGCLHKIFLKSSFSYSVCFDYIYILQTFCVYEYN